MAPLPHHRDDRLEVRKACVGPWENNVYVVACLSTNRSVIVDAAAEPDRIVALAAGTEPIAILTTHGHADHVGAAQAVAERMAIPFRMNPGDAAIAGMDPDQPIGVDPIAVGDVEMRPILTPGHTPGSTCFSMPGIVLTGDTLFPGGPGATRGPGASFATIIRSIEDELLGLGDDTLVLPGHGLDTTIGAERPHLPDWVGRGW
jgi:glyoxylase-like metal-dependent hydrolase (beta-lactamase superfamily II)